MALSRHGRGTIVPLAAVVMLLFAGAAQAWNCAAGLTDCNGCYNLQTDSNNCGKCGNKCGGCSNGGPVCSSGKCGFTCSSPYQNCDNNWGNGCEVDTSTDVNNCGACGTKCIAPPHATASCVGGKCQYTCVAGWNNCDGNWANGCETNVNGPDCGNCGGCGTKCSSAPHASPTCSSGKCGYSCSPGFSNCDNSWTNGCEVCVTNDVNNCGGCGKKCLALPNASATCSNGQCSYTCNAGYANCDNNWANGCECTPGSDVNNCGGCGKKCLALPNASATCSYGQCTYTCNVGYSNCDNNWMNGCECSPQTDVNHCGGCGNECPQANYYGGERRCTAGKCETNACQQGLSYDFGKRCCVNGGQGGGNGGGRGGNGGGSWGGVGGGNGGRGGGSGGRSGGSGGRGGGSGGRGGGRGGGW